MMYVCCELERHPVLSICRWPLWDGSYTLGQQSWFWTKHMGVRRNGPGGNCKSHRQYVVRVQVAIYYMLCYAFGHASDTSIPIDIVKRQEARTLAYIGYELAALAYNESPRDCPRSVVNVVRTGMLRSTGSPVKLLWRDIPTRRPS
jgi:hypothetical protein